MQAKDPDFYLTGYLRRKLKRTVNAIERPLRGLTAARSSAHQNSNTDDTEVSNEDPEGEFIDLLEFQSENLEEIIDDAIPKQCQYFHSPDNSSPCCLRDVCLPPPAGTISPPIHPLSSGIGLATALSPLFLQPLQMLWDTDASGDESQTGGGDLRSNGDGFYDLCASGFNSEDNETQPSVEEDLFETDLGDMRLLDPAFHPPAFPLGMSGGSLHHRETKDTGIGVNTKDASRRRGGDTGCTDRAVSGPNEDGIVSPALASFASSAVSLRGIQGGAHQDGRRERGVRLNLSQAAATLPDGNDDLDIWKFTTAALTERNLLGFLQTDSSPSFLLGGQF